MMTEGGDGDLAPKPIVSVIADRGVIGALMGVAMRRRRDCLEAPRTEESG